MLYRDPGSGFWRGLLAGAAVMAVVMLSFPVVAAVGGSMILGKPNNANAVTSLSGAATTNLRITNTQPAAPALDLRVAAGAPPLKVNSTARVPNLNADRLDGKHAGAFALVAHTHAGVYLLVGDQATDSALLNGLASSAFSLTGHDHDADYLGLLDRASDSDRLDGQHASAFALAAHAHDAAAIASGTLADARFSAYGDLGVEGYLNNDAAGDLLTRAQADGRFLGIGAAAANSLLLGGLDSSAFSLLGHDHDGAYLGIGATATNSDLLDGQHASAFSPTGHAHDASYVSIVAGAAAGSFPTLTAGGELANSAWGPASFAAAVHTHDAGQITTGSLAEGRYSAYGDLGVEGYLNADAGVDLLTRAQADGRFVNEGDPAADADRLDGEDSDSFARRSMVCAPGTSVGYSRLGPICSGMVGSVALDSVGNTGLHTSLVLDARGFPVIAYYDATNGDLRVLRCGDASCASGNVTMTVDAAGDVGGYASLVLDAQGFPVIAYYDATNGDLKVAHCTDATCRSDTSITAVKTVGDVGRYASLVLGVSGHPIVAYHDASEAKLQIVFCGDATCSSGNYMGNSGTGGQFAALALRPSGYVTASYYDPANGDLRLLLQYDAGWWDGPIVSADVIGTYTSMAVSASGLPVISYRDETRQDLNVIVCGTPTCTSGNTIVLPDTTGDVGAFTSIVLDAADRPVVSYYDVTNGDLKIMECGDRLCTTWTVTVVDAAGSVGAHTSLTLDSQGHAVVSYYDIDNLDLKLAAVLG